MLQFNTSRGVLTSRAQAAPAARSCAPAMLHRQHRACATEAWRRDSESTSSQVGVAQEGGRAAWFASATLAVGLLAAPMGMMLAPPAFAVENASGQEAAVQAYQDLESKGKMTQKSLDDLRLNYNFKRTMDGRVMLKDSKGEWFNVRLDLEVPGSLLLRDSKGVIYAMQSEGLKQIDLSDDYIVLMMFANGDWEEGKMKLSYGDDDGKEVTLTMEEKDFRQVIGILKQLEGEDGDEQGSSS